MRISRDKLLGFAQDTSRQLGLPRFRRPEPDAASNGVHRTEIEVPPVFVWLPAVEHRSFERPPAQLEGRGRYAEADMGRVEGVVTERRQYQTACRRTMHERDRP